MTQTSILRRSLAPWIAGALALIVAGCSGSTGERTDFVDRTRPPTATMTMAVLPFENLTNHPNAGVIAAQLMTTALYEQSVFRIQEESDTRKRLADLKIDPTKLSDVADAKRVAGALEVDAVLVGTVTEFGYQHGLREEPVVGLNARLVSADTGSVLWASSRSRMGGGYLARGSLNGTAQDVVAGMASSLSGAAKR